MLRTEIDNHVRSNVIKSDCKFIYTFVFNLFKVTDVEISAIKS